LKKDLKRFSLSSKGQGVYHCLIGTPKEGRQKFDGRLGGRRNDLPRYIGDGPSGILSYGERAINFSSDLPEEKTISTDPDFCPQVQRFSFLQENVPFRLRVSRIAETRFDFPQALFPTIPVKAENSTSRSRCCL